MPSPWEKLAIDVNFLWRIEWLLKKKIDMACRGTFLDKYNDEIVDRIEKLAKNKTHHIWLNQNDRNLVSKRGVLNVKGMEPNIEMDMVKKGLGKEVKSTEKLTKLMQNFVTNPNISHVRHSSPCSIYFGDDHANGECQEIEEVCLELWSAS